MKLLNSILILTLSFTILQAQNLTDALRYSQTTIGGTARTVGSGGAFNSLGADFSVLSINPAGLAYYRTSEFTITPSFLSGSQDAFLTDDPNVDQSTVDSKFFLENIGVVIARNKPNGRVLKTSNFGIGVNRIADFNESFTYGGSGRGSITNRFRDNADGLFPDELDDFESGLAFETGAIFDFNEDNFYDTDFIDSDIIRRDQTVDRSGGISELNFAWAGNYFEKFSLGIGIGIPIITFEEEKSYTESDPGDLIPVFNDLRFQESLTVSGAGINLKIGTILTLVKNFRLGASIQTPTRYTISEDFNTSLGYSFTLDDEDSILRSESPDGSFRYRLRTPFTANLGLSYLIITGKINGFVSASAEFRNYSSNNFDFTSFSDNPDDAAFETFVNNELDQTLGSVVNYNIGGELAYSKWRIRGGLILQESAFIDDDGDFDTITSFGLGYRANRFYIDAALRMSSGDEGYVPYRDFDTSREKLVNVTKNFNKLLLTVGYKF
jgi:hypothetical protein